MTDSGDEIGRGARADDVDICIASIGRPSLARTLRSLEDIKYPFPIHVLIADDSPDQSAKRIVAKGAPWKFTVQVHDVASQNIATARNACLTRATGKFIAFLDDDEWAHPHWLSRLVETAKTSRADAVFGPIEAIYPAGAPQHVVKAKPFHRRPGMTGSRVSTGGTGNVLMLRASIERYALSFNEAFGRTGGEDTDFFYRLASKGGILVAAAEAIVYEEVPPSRLDPRHLQRRYMRGGYTFAQVLLAGSSIGSRCAFYLTTASKILATGSIAILLRPIRADISLTYAIRSWAHIGKLLYAFGCRAPSPY